MQILIQWGLWEAWDSAFLTGFQVIVGPLAILLSNRLNHWHGLGIKFQWSPFPVCTWQCRWTWSLGLAKETDLVLKKRPDVVVKQAEMTLWFQDGFHSVSPSLCNPYVINRWVMPESPRLELGGNMLGYSQCLFMIWVLSEIIICLNPRCICTMESSPKVLLAARI